MMQVSCDPLQEECFVHVCDVTFESCTGDVSVDTTYYKIIQKLAKMMPACSNGDCEEPVCAESEVVCEIINCTEEAASASGESCSDVTELNEDDVDENNGATEEVIL